MVDRWLLGEEQAEMEAAGAAMDVTLSELLAAFMESPLVLWVSPASIRRFLSPGSMSTHQIEHLQTPKPPK